MGDMLMESKKKKVIHVLGLSSIYSGNIVPSLVKLAKELSKNNMELAFIFPYAANDKEWCKMLEEEYSVYYIPQKQFSISTVYQLKKIFRIENPDIIHTHHDYYDIPVTIAAPKKSKIIWHFHNSTTLLENGIKRKLKKKVHYGIIGKKAWLISVSEYYRNLVIEEGFSKDKTITILNGIDFSRLDNKIKQSKSDKSKKIILAFGHPPLVKGIDLLLNACESIITLNKSFELWLVFSEEVDLKFIRERYGNNCPEWLVIKPPVTNIKDYYLSSDIFISPSRYETFSYSVAEAVYCGLPVISSNIPGLEWAHNIQNVKFFESENVEQLIDVICDTLFEKLDINEKSTNQSIAYVTEKLSLEIWASEIIDFYSSNSK